MGKETAKEPSATVYTRDKAAMRKLYSLVGNFPDIYKPAEQDEVSKTYFFLKSRVSCHKPKTGNIRPREGARQMMIRSNVMEMR